jgi:hypothetical protein
MTISVQTVATGLTIFVALGIIFIGIRECFQPSVAARQFGVPFATPADRDFLAIKASRDIAPGVAVLALLAIGDHRAVAYAMLALTLIPILDGVVVLKHADWIFKPAILIHWGTAAVMLMIVALFQGAM